MISPGMMAIAALTVMLWILWSDTIRARRPSQILYAVRIGLFLTVSGILILNIFRRPELFAGTSRVLAIVAALIGILGAGYFGRRLVTRR
jgi:hypothetical protein